jgi:flagellar capping protein FliD
VGLSDRLAAQITDLKGEIDRLDARYAADKATLQAKLQALKNLKQSWSQQLDDLCNQAGVDLT